MLYFVHILCSKFHISLTLMLMFLILTLIMSGRGKHLRRLYVLLEEITAVYHGLSSPYSRDCLMGCLPISGSGSWFWQGTIQRRWYLFDEHGIPSTFLGMGRIALSLVEEENEGRAGWWGRGLSWSANRRIHPFGDGQELIMVSIYLVCRHDVAVICLCISCVLN